MANITDDFPPASTSDSSQKLILVFASVLIILACCVIFSVVILWRFDITGENWGSPVSLVLRPSPTASPTATPFPTATPSYTFTPLPTATPSPAFTPTATPTVEPTYTPNPTPSPLLTFPPRPVTPTPLPLFANTTLDLDNFTAITNPFQSELALFHWYLVQVAPDSRWVDRVNLSQYDRGFGLKSIDYQNCSALCNVAAVQVVPAEAGKLYTLSADSSKEPGSSDGLIYLDFLNTDNVSIEANAQKEHAAGQWQTHTLAARAPAGAAYLRVILYSTNTGQGVIYWDNVTLKMSE